MNPKKLAFSLFLTAFAFFPRAQAAADRISGTIDRGRTVVLQGQVHPKAQLQFDQGMADPGLRMGSLTLRLNLADGIDSFLEELQNPASPNYHRWLTPEQFADRFGASASDIGKITHWLTASGFTVNRVGRGGQWVSFRGTAAQVTAAFHTPIHHYRVNGVMHYANISEPSIPAALAGIVRAVGGLNDFKLSPMYAKAARADNNTGTAHYLAPDDLATIYDIKPLYAAGIDGTGQTIAIAGQTDIDLADIRGFRKSFNLPPNDPQIVLDGDDPGTSPDDLSEADIDLEWSGAIARNATIIYVNSTDVIESVAYAIDNALAPVISMSYGGCETENDPGLRSLAQQANAEGITWVVSSGDTGAAGCDFSTFTPWAEKGKVATFPATIPEVTAIGGTTLNEGTGAFWSAANGPNQDSALGYIPEVGWNDSLLRNDLAASGGGASVFFPKPAWQTGPGVPADNARDIPDVSFPASPDHDGYLVISGGTSEVFGGTSVGAPVFAGVVAVLNQKLGTGSTGLGNINGRIYALAQTRPAAFHDTVGGDNIVPCVANTPDCVNGSFGYSATAGYDLATGLGSIDVYHFVTEWINGANSTTTLTANPGTASPGDTVQLVATVTGSFLNAPTGTVTFLANGQTLGTVNVVPKGATAVATFGASATILAVSDGAVSALYNGDNNYNDSGASATVNITYPQTGSAVIPLVAPSPAYQFGGEWFFDVILIEKAGVATKLTGFTVDSLNVPLATFFPDPEIPAGGVQFTSISLFNFSYPADHIFHFTGIDADGRTWSQEIPVSFLGPASNSLFPAITLSSTPSTVSFNPSADPSCPFVQQLVVEEKNGFLTQLSQLRAGSVTLAGTGIQQVFGTTRLAPYGTLRGSLCWDKTTTPGSKAFTLIGSSEGVQVGALATIPFTATPAAPAAISVTPTAVNLAVADASKSTGATLTLNVTGGEALWRATISPQGRMGKWLTVSPSSGSGPAQISLQATPAGLANGVYQAVVVLQSANAFPQGINILVTLTVGAGSGTTISSIANAASAKAGLAPGAQMVITGSQLAATSLQAQGFPLPLALGGVTVTVNNVPAPLYSVSPSRLTVQLPYETGAGPAVVSVNHGGNVAGLTIPVGVAAPAIYADVNGFLASSSTGQQGQTVTAFITGDGDETPLLVTGETPLSSTSLSRLPRPRLPLTVTVGGIPARVVFEGIPHGLAGVTQVNFVVPATTPLGPQPVVVNVGGTPSPPANLSVTAPPS